MGQGRGKNQIEGQEGIIVLTKGSLKLEKERATEEGALSDGFLVGVHAGKKDPAGESEQRLRAFF